MASSGVLLPGQGKVSSTSITSSGANKATGPDDAPRKQSPNDLKAANGNVGAMNGKETAASLEQSLSTMHGIVPTLQ